MDESKDSAMSQSPAKATLGSRIAYFTPIHSMRRAGASMVDAKGRITQMFREFQSSLPSRDPNAVYAEDDVRQIEDAGERFQAMYEMHGWNEDEMAQQIRACSRTKIAGLCVSIVCLVATFSALLFAPLWMLFFITPLGGCGVILGVSQAFKFALFETQLKLRSLIDAKTFYSREDFFQRMIG